jgi:hypothetical protein
MKTETNLKPPCSVEGCTYQAHTKGMCSTHYTRMRKGMDLAAPIRRRANAHNVGRCTVDECPEGRQYRGMCSMHYSRWRKHGDALRGHRRGICTIEACGAPAQARKLCPSHYQRELYRGSFGKPLCSIEDCSRQVRTKGLCGLHYQRQRAGKSMQPGLLRRDLGTGTVMNGYVRVPVGGGSRVPAHRLVMEQIVGRKLQPFENVHHINGVRHDNRPENLELWAKPQPNGQRVADLVAWVVENYAEEVRILLG